MGGDDLLALLQGDLEHRHGGALDFGLHDRSRRTLYAQEPTGCVTTCCICRGPCPISASAGRRGLAL